MIEKLLYLNPGEFKRLMPFFILHLILFVMLYLGEGISLSLFINKVGAAKLPNYYAITALINCLFVFIYLFYVDKLSNILLFRIILFITLFNYLIAYIILQFSGQNIWCFGLFLVNRELAQVMILTHFGNFIMDYFTRAELNRVLPIIYSGGRIGGIIGGIILSQLSEVIGVINLLFVYFAVGIASLVYLFFISKLTVIDESKEERKYSESYFGFFVSIIKYPLLFWLTITTIIFFFSRFFLFFEYNNYFETYFSSAEKMASFLGTYSIIALTVSALLQTFIVGRLVAYIGLKGTLFIYNFLIVLAMLLNLFPMTIQSAIFSRLLENELRIGLRNPIYQLVTNLLDKSVRARARALMLGGIYPLSTLIASIILGIILFYWNNHLVVIVGFIIGLLYFIVNFYLFNNFNEKPKLFTLFQKVESK